MIITTEFRVLGLGFGVLGFKVGLRLEYKVCGFLQGKEGKTQTRNPET